MVFQPGDFNLIRNRFKNIGPSFNYTLSVRFNALIARLSLIELPLSGRRFTWSRSVHSVSNCLGNSLPFL